jgi:hypothetical protein
MKFIAYKRDEDGDYILIYKAKNGYHYDCLVHSIHGLQAAIFESEIIKLKPGIDVKTYIAVLDNEIEHKINI